MKKALFIVLVFMMIAAPLSGCETKSEEGIALEQAYEELSNAQENAENARNRYESLNEAIDDYKRAVDKLG